MPYVAGGAPGRGCRDGELGSDAAAICRPDLLRERKDSVGMASYGLARHKRQCFGSGAARFRPFSKLCPSLWVLANAAYLREMDWIATRRSASQPNPPKNIEPAGDDPADLKKKPLSPLKWTANKAYSGFM